MSFELPIGDIGCSETYHEKAPDSPTYLRHKLIIAKRALFVIYVGLEKKRRRVRSYRAANM